MIKTFLSKSFGGLSKEYFLRQLMFALIMYSLYIYYAIFSSSGSRHGDWVTILFMTVSTLLYPYSRFVYETVVNTIIGDNNFQVGGIIFLFCKIATMLMCWIYALLVAPVCLLFLFGYHSIKERRKLVDE